MRVYELLGKLKKIEENKKRVIDKLPEGVRSKDTEVTLNYFTDILPLLADVDELKFMLERLQVDYAGEGIGSKNE